jgi:hypothetical protein
MNRESMGSLAGTSRNADDQFDFPLRVAINSAGEIDVTDSSSDRSRVFVPA